MVSQQEYVNLIERLLSSHNKQFKNSHEQMLWERGYLTGILASLCRQDFYASQIIEAQIKQLTDKKH